MVIAKNKQGHVLCHWIFKDRVYWLVQCARCGKKIMKFLCYRDICALYGFSLCIIHCLRGSKRMSEHDNNIFRVVNSKLSEYRCVNLLYIEHGDECFVCKVSRLLYRIYLFCIWCCGWHKQGGSEILWIMQEFVHAIYYRYIDDNLCEHEVDERRVRYELKYKK